MLPINYVSYVIEVLIERWTGWKCLNRWCSTDLKEISTSERASTPKFRFVRSAHDRRKENLKVGVKHCSKKRVFQRFGWHLSGNHKMLYWFRDFPTCNDSRSSLHSLSTSYARLQYGTLQRLSSCPIYSTRSVVCEQVLPREWETLKLLVFFF